VQSRREKVQVAAISAHNDTTIGELVADSVEMVGFGDRRKEMLQDMAILTGGKVIAEELGIKIESLTTSDQWVYW